MDFTVARDRETFDAAFRLVHDRYVWRDYMAPDPSGRRINLRHALPSTRVFVARAADQVVGTVSVFQDSALGLPIDDLYRPELDLLRNEGRQLVEASHLATAPEGRLIGIALVMRLFRVMLLYLAEFTGVDDLCLAVSPRHAAFYESFIECEVIGDVRFYETVGVPAVAMRLDLQRVRDISAELRDGGLRDHEVRSFLYDPDVLPVIARRLERDGPRAALTPALFAHFFNGSSVMRNATLEQRLFVRWNRPAVAEPAHRWPGVGADSRMSPAAGDRQVAVAGARR
jgi:hypothetical protein